MSINSILSVSLDSKTTFLHFFRMFLKILYSFNFITCLNFSFYRKVFSISLNKFEKVVLLIKTNCDLTNLLDAKRVFKKKNKSRLSWLKYSKYARPSLIRSLYSLIQSASLIIHVKSEYFLRRVFSP